MAVHFSPPPAWNRTPAENQDRRRKPGEHICFLLPQKPVEQPVPRLACCRSTRQSDSKLDGAVNVSALMIDMIQEPVDIPVLTGFADAKISTRNMPPLVRQMTSEDYLSANKEVMAEVFWDTFVGGPTTTPLKIAGMTVDLAGDVTVGVAPLANLAGDVTVGVAFLGDLVEVVTASVVSSADLAEVVTVSVASSADLAGDVTAGVASSADLAGIVTVGVASSADLTGDVTSGVASSADLARVVTAGVASSVELAGVVTVGVASSAEIAGVVTVGVALCLSW